MAGTGRVSLFITCLADTFFPEVGEAVVGLLRHLGMSVDFPPDQTCCGQPAFNAGHWREAKRLARRFLAVFRDSGVIVSPSGSCVSMVRHHFPRMLADEPESLERAREVSARTYELSQFLAEVLGVVDLGAALPGRVTYHDGCHAMRLLGVRDGPRRMLRAVRGLELVEMDDAASCCGFGGVFSARMPEISAAILEEKVRRIEGSGARAVVSTDCGCLMHLQGLISRRGLAIETIHLAELLHRGLGRAG